MNKTHIVDSENESENESENDRGYAFSISEVDLEIDGYVNDVRAALPKGMAAHVDQRRRCKCKRYVTDLSAHPCPMGDGVGGRGKHCRLPPLNAQDYTDSKCEERDAWKLIKETVVTQRGQDVAMRDMRIELDWTKDQLAHMDEKTKEKIEQAYTANNILVECVEKMKSAVEQFVESPKPYRSAETNKLIFITNKAILRMKNIKLSQDESEEEVEKSEDEYYEEWPDDWDETEDESQKNDDLIPSIRTNYSEKRDEQNTSKNENLEQGGDKKVEEGATGGKEEDPPPNIETPKGPAVPASTGARSKEQAGKDGDEKNKKKERDKDKHVVIDDSGNTRHTGLLPRLRIGRNGESSIAFVPDDDNQGHDEDEVGSAPPTPPPGASMSGPLRHAPRGYQLPGLLEPTLPLYHQTGGTLCGGYPVIEESKYLAKVITITPKREHSAEQWIDHWAQLLLQLKVHAGISSLYTILTIWVKNTPTLYKYYSDMLDKEAFFTSFEHFIEVFARQTYPNLKTVALTKLQHFKQRDNQSVREYRLEMVQLVKLAGRKDQDYVYEFIGGLKSDRHKRVIESHDWQEELSIDGITDYLSRMEDIIRINKAMQKPASVNATNADRGRRSASVQSATRGAPRGRSAHRGSRGSARGPGRGRGTYRGSSRGSGRGDFRQRPASVAGASVSAMFRGGFRGRTRSRGFRGRGFTRGAAPNYNGRGGSSARGGKTISGSSMTFPERSAIVKVRRKNLNLMGGNKQICEACFSTNHLWTDATFSNCTMNCLFCNKNINSVKHGHLECYQRPPGYKGQRMAILNRFPILNSA